jgi:hypothetical protein
MGSGLVTRKKARISRQEEVVAHQAKVEAVDGARTGEEPVATGGACVEKELEPGRSSRRRL